MSLSSVNQATLLGNVTRDLELRYTQSGKAFLPFSMATNHSVKKGEEWVQIATYHNVVIWGKQAEYIAQNASKGTKIFVQGRITNRKYQKKDGSDAYVTEILAETVVVMSSGVKRASQPAEAANDGGEADPADMVDETSTTADDIADDIPF